MNQNPRKIVRSWLLSSLVFSFGLTIAPVPLKAETPGSSCPPQLLTLGTAVAWALENNPQIMAARQQHGIAAAQVVIAETYPFNPTAENRVQYATGPPSAGVSNAVPLENLFLLEMEVRGQGKHRRRAAAAALSRTDWEIVFQEQTLAVNVLRAFYSLLYRQEKLRLAEETFRLDEQLLKDVQALRQAGQLQAADLILAQTEADDARTFLGAGRTSLITTRSDLFRALGVVEGIFEIQGNLVIPPQPLDSIGVTQVALERRGDLHARQEAINEAEANLRLTMANRFGNPTIGPIFTYDPTRVSSVGAQINVPLPVLNTHKGDIEQRQAERAKAYLDLRQAEVAVRQDVQAALVRLESAQARAETYRRQILPNLQNALDDIRKLLRAGSAGVDVLRVIDVQRKLLHARDAYLDTLFEVTQAQADLVAAAGEPLLAIGPCGPPPKSSQAQSLDNR